MIVEGDRFSTGEQIVAADVDIEFLRSERMRRNTFADYGTTLPPRRIAITLPAAAESAFDRTVDPAPFVPHDSGDRRSRCEEIFAIQESRSGQTPRPYGVPLRRRRHIGRSRFDAGAARDAARIRPPRTRPQRYNRRNDAGFGTTGRTYRNAVTLVRKSGATLREISIAAACRQHFADIGLPDEDRSVTYENSQARERTQILMDVANMQGGIVIGTGDLSELALGWATYNGDHMSMYGVNCSVQDSGATHGRVGRVGGDERRLRLALEDVAATPVSPELLPADESGT